MMGSKLFRYPFTNGANKQSIEELLEILLILLIIPHFSNATKSFNLITVNLESADLILNKGFVSKSSEVLFIHSSTDFLISIEFLKWNLLEDLVFQIEINWSKSAQKVIRIDSFSIDLG